MLAKMMSLKTYALLLVVLILLVGVSACAAPGPTMTVRDAWARAASTQDKTFTGAAMGEGHNAMHAAAMSEGMSSSAVYLTLVNTGNSDDVLLGVSSDAAAIVAMHTVETQNGEKKMQHLSQITVPAQSEVQLKPGSFHIMLVDLKRDLQQGETIDVTLVFQKAGVVNVKAQVRNAS